MTAADFDRVMGVNVRGTFLCSREASRQMIKQQSGLYHQYRFHRRVTSFL
jgi:NAD(P)-dependent dehydrogenase (short-subunit alcohol dehydrogenase family)